MKNTKFSEKSRGTLAVAALILFLGGISFAAVRAKQSLVKAAPKTTSAHTGNPVNVPIVFTSRGRSAKARAWVPTEPVKPVSLPFSGSSTMQWLPDYSGVLVAADDMPMVLHRYNSRTQEFGPPEDVAKHLANEGVDYTIRLSSTQDFAPSPDKTKLVYGDEKGVHLFNLKTGEKQLLLERSNINKRDAAGKYEDAPQYFAWAPDSTRIAFSVEGNKQMGLQGVNPIEELYLVDVDGKNLRHVGQGFSPSWSPNKRYIVAIDGAANGGKQLVRFDTETKDRRVLDTAKLATFHFVSYSPDGKHLAVIGKAKPKDYSESLYLATPEGEIERVIVSQDKMPNVVLGSRGSRADW